MEIREQVWQSLFSPSIIWDVGIGLGLGAGGRCLYLLCHFASPVLESFHPAGLEFLEEKDNTPNGSNKDLTELVKCPPSHFGLLL